MPNGKVAFIEQTSDIGGSLLGKEGTIKSNITDADVRAVR